MQTFDSKYLAAGIANRNVSRFNKYDRWNIIIITLRNINIKKNYFTYTINKYGRHSYYRYSAKKKKKKKNLISGSIR